MTGTAASPAHASLTAPGATTSALDEPDVHADVHVAVNIVDNNDDGRYAAAP